MIEIGPISKAEAFRAMHHQEAPLVLPNVWDAGTAVMAADAGFPAIATTSAGVAWAQGYPDGEIIDPDLMIAVIERIARRVHIPVTADIEAGYGRSPEAVAHTVQLATVAGAVGINLEDGIDHVAGTLFEKDLAVERIAAARAAAKAAYVPIVINARTDVFFDRARDNAAKLDEAIDRCNAYLAAGADCVYAIAVQDAEIIGRLVEGIDGPVNIAAGAAGLDVAGLTALGVKRISVAGALTRVAFGSLKSALTELKGGRFGFIENALPHPELNKLYADH